MEQNSSWLILTILYIKIKVSFKPNALEMCSKKEVKIGSLLSCIRHLAKGSPVKPAAHVQIGLWFTTWQRALKPHVPGHGSWHFWLIQARFCGQSELTTHWGLHVGGEPTQPGWQEHTAWLSTTRHTLLGPHGLGKQGFAGQAGAKAVYQRRKERAVLCEVQDINQCKIIHTTVECILYKQGVC